MIEIKAEVAMKIKNGTKLRSAWLIDYKSYKSGYYQ